MQPSSNSEFRALPIINNIINNQLCVGCGVCLVQEGVDPQISMKWNEQGFLVPDLSDVNNLPDNAVKVCPFNTSPDRAVRTEDELAAIYLSESSKKVNKIGRFENCYVGYSKEFRTTSSSGGLATYLTKELFNQGIADHAIVVGAVEGSDSHYNYTIIHKGEDVKKSSKTKYYPVTMAEVLKEIKNLPGKVMVSGIPCFVKSIRLHQYYNPDFSNKVAFVIGIVCGGMKSKYYADYLAGRAGATSLNYKNPNFRVKDLNSRALDYSFSCDDPKKGSLSIKMNRLGDMWGTGLFKNNACDFCDDVAAELADITLGDAWIPPYSQDGAGTSVIITRSTLADKIIKEGLDAGQLNLEELTPVQFIQSQQGGYNHRHAGMKYRERISGIPKDQLPPRRYNTETIPLEFKLVQKQRMNVRAQSLIQWKKTGNVIEFQNEISPYLDKLGYYTSWYHRVKKIKKFFL